MIYILERLRRKIFIYYISNSSSAVNAMPLARYTKFSVFYLQ